MDGVIRFLTMWLLIVGMFVGGIIFGRATMPPRIPVESQVEDKAESDGRCYVAVWVEVTPEDYIGLDIGDEYEIK